MNETAVEAEAFAELMRRMALNVLQNLIAKEYQTATDSAEALLNEAIRRKREFQAIVTRSDPERFDLSTLVVDPNAPNDEAEGQKYD